MDENDEPTLPALRATLDDTFQNALDRITNALKEEGFGVLTEVNVREVMRAKLDVDFEKYVILGACNPGLAHRALTTNMNVGLLLPCNVIVFQREDGAVQVEAADPVAIMSAVGDLGVAEVAQEARARLARAIATLRPKRT
jgi:uncharacterized protein (DUF302 family)